ncbi:hypothetical protein PF002_g15029 [Phytophthora fragariae]|uniref:Uncharacterized protein n=1 Tax=Phytophthora fragariae TaxID=53985 RepID=A0A6A4D7Y4_9STRA|nr:hypothetical protein PF002_g15029 [Phytophthora fragariae]KAE9303241.1 hypothetical protein PF001_g13642 [Phytophthora fragariae]
MTGFTSRWAELTKKGWKSKRPTGLSNDHTYLRPGKTKKDVRGVDYFVGAEELMKYLDKVDLDAARQAAAASPRSGAAAGAPKAVEEVDSAAASTDATATSASARLLQRHRAPVLQFEHNLLTYSDANSDDVVAPRRNLNDEFNEADGGESSPQSRLSARIAAITSADLNIVLETDNPDDFGAMESDAENDDGASDWTESSFGEDEPCDDDMSMNEEAQELDEPLFDEAWLDVAGGIENVASGTINADILKNMGVNGWSDPVSYSPFPYLDEPFEQRPIESLREDYPHLYDGPLLAR